MESNTSDAHTHVEPGPSTAMPSAAERPLKIRWGRTLVALVGLIALLVAGISGALSMLSLTTSGADLDLPCRVWCGGCRAADTGRAGPKCSSRCPACCRATSKLASSQASTPAPEPRETALFDGAEGAPPAPVQKPLTAEELRTAALRVAAKGTADAKLAHTQTLAEGELEAETWEPVEVPVPGYVTAARAASKAEPLAIPAAPNPPAPPSRLTRPVLALPASTTALRLFPTYPDEGSTSPCRRTRCRCPFGARKLRAEQPG